MPLGGLTTWHGVQTTAEYSGQMNGLHPHTSLSHPSVQIIFCAKTAHGFPISGSPASPASQQSPCDLALTSLQLFDI